MKTLTLLLLACLPLFAFAPAQKIDAVKFLAGTWKAENKNEYESWKMSGNTTMKGIAYNMKGKKQTITEYLEISMGSNGVVYTAIVLGQNNEQPVKFKLNDAIKNKLAFENPGHDFPKKIQYTKLNDTTLFVEVLGDGDKGFSYKMMKTK